MLGEKKTEQGRCSDTCLGINKEVGELAMQLLETNSREELMQRP